MSSPDFLPSKRVTEPHTSLTAYPHFMGDYADFMRAQEPVLAGANMLREPPEGLDEIYDHVPRALFSRNLCTAILLAKRGLPICLVDNGPENPYPHLADRITIYTDKSAYGRGEVVRYLWPVRAPSPLERIMNGISAGDLCLPINPPGRTRGIAQWPDKGESTLKTMAFYARARMTGSLSLAFTCGGPEHTPLDTMAAYETE